MNLQLLGSQVDLHKVGAGCCLYDFSHLLILFCFLTVTMCGIFAVFDHNGDVTSLRERAVQLSQRLRHRGPDWTGCYIANQSVLCHERLAIVDLGMCPPSPLPSPLPSPFSSI